MPTVSHISAAEAAKPAMPTKEMGKEALGSNKPRTSKADVVISFVAGAAFFALSLALSVAALVCMATGFGLVVTAPLAIAGTICGIVSVGVFCHFQHKVNQYRMTRFIECLEALKTLHSDYRDKPDSV